MRDSLILDKVARNETAWCVTLHFADPSVYELVSLLGVDGIWMDLEHHGTSVQTASQLMRASRVGNVDIVARPAKGEFMRMARLLEVGATAIMYPRCETPTEAKEIVRWGKFCPLGERGFDGANADMPYCSMDATEYVRAANEKTFLIAQLEDPKAVEHAEAILAVEGISMVMLGPADFSVLSGFPGNINHPKIQTALEQIAAAARNTGKHWAATAPTIELAKLLIELGCRLIFHQADILILKAGIQAARKSLEGIGVPLRPMQLPK